MGLQVAAPHKGLHGMALPPTAPAIRANTARNDGQRARPGETAAELAFLQLHLADRSGRRKTVSPRLRRKA